MCMESIKISKATVLTSPNPVTLICTQTPEGKTNLATVSWWTYLSFKPAMIGFAMQKTAYSGELTRQSKKVMLTVPGAELAVAVMQCGSVSGRNKDKAKEYGIELMNVSDSLIQIPVGSKLVFDCTLSETVDVGDHSFYICNVDNIFADETQKQLFAWKGYADIRPIPE